MTYSKPVLLAKSTVERRKLTACSSQHTCFRSCQTSS
jgi:hypothetical protein